MWSYNTNRDSEMKYFQTHEETVFAIMCVMRYQAVTNEVPDYYIYKDGVYVDSLEGDFLYNLYIENGGVTPEDEGHNPQSIKNKNSKSISEKTRKKRHIGGKCISVSDDYITIAYKTSYERLLLEAIGRKGVLVSVFAIENSKSIIEDVLHMLTEREQDILKLLYGISESGMYGKSRTEAAELYGISAERVRQIEARALRKLRHSLRYPILIGRKIANSNCENSTEYLRKLKEILINEIEDLIKISDTDSIYIKKIMNRYNIEIKNTTVKNLDIEESGLSIRTYNCLKHAGINNLVDLMKFPDEKLQQVRNLGRKCYEEAKELKNKSFGINKNGCNTITIKLNGEKVVYKYINLDIKQIAMAILKEIEDMEPAKNTIFEMQISSRLLEMLLVNGYLFFEDVLEDSILLTAQFEKNDMKDIAEEIEKLVSDEAKKKKYVYLYPAVDSVCKFIKNNDCTSALDFIRKANGTDDDDIQNLVQELQNNGFIYE